MSTKIYHAARLPKDRLNEYLREVRRLTKREFYSFFESIMIRLKMDVVMEKIKEVGSEVGWDDEVKKNTFYRMTYLCERAKESSAKVTKSLFDFDCGVWVFLDKEYAYIIPYGRFTSLNLGDYVEEYGYWNNTDRLESLTEEEWEARGEKWEELIPHYYNREDGLIHIIVDFTPGQAYITEAEVWSYFMDGDRGML